MRETATEEAPGELKRIDVKDAPDRPLERYIKVLEVVAAFPERVVLQDVVNILGFPKTTAYRLLKGLQDPISSGCRSRAATSSRPGSCTSSCPAARTRRSSG